MTGGIIKRKDGFTLLEIIISIAALSLISVVILRMFIASSSLNDTARDTDIAVNRSMTEIEKIKRHSSLSDYLKTEAEGDIYEMPDSVTVSYYYDKDWSAVDGGNLETNGAKYCLKLNISPEDEKAALGGTLYAIEAYVTDVSSNESEQLLTSLRTKKYFPKGSGEGSV